METIELGDKTLLQKETGQLFECRAVIGPTIAKAECAKLRSVEEYCGPKLFGAFVEEFEICAKELALACREFGRVIRPICPFDPIYALDRIKLEAMVGQLQMRVEELEALRHK